MTLVVHLPEELARRVEAVAAARNQNPEQVALEAIEAQLPAPRRFSFIGMGHSGQANLSGRLKELRCQVAEEKLTAERGPAEG
jgi:hypothetical protein